MNIQLFRISNTSLENIDEDSAMRTDVGMERHNETPEKLKALCPNEDLTEGRFIKHEERV